MAETVGDSIATAAGGDLSCGEEYGVGDFTGSESIDSAPAPDAPVSIRDTLEQVSADFANGDRDAAAIDESFKPYADRMKAAGLTRAGVVKEALELARQVHADPAAMIQALAWRRSLVAVAAVRRCSRCAPRSTSC
jgi:hypothetical protein